MRQKHITWKRGLLALLIALLAWCAWKTPQWLAFGRGVQAYFYGYSLVTSDITRQLLTSPGIPKRLGSGPVNQFNHVREFPDHKFRDVVAPNADTLYSIAWLDLSQGPLVMHQPDMGGRYVVFGLLDAWSNSRSLGTRVYGPGPVDYVLVGPGWKGALPPGLTRIDVPTQIAWFIGRTLTRGKEDYAAVHAIQDKYALIPLARYGLAKTGAAAEKPAPEITVGGPAVDIVTPVVTQVAQLDAISYFDRMARLMAANPPAEADAPMLATLAKLGITPGQPLDASKLSSAQRQGLEDARGFVRGLFEARAAGTQGRLEQSGFERWFFAKLIDLINKRMLNVQNTWLLPLNLGQYGTQYPLRAVVTLVGFGANPAADAVYPKTSVDAEGRQLEGSQRYVLHFDKDKLPPADAFWSMSMYDEASFFVDNPIGRYAIGDRDKLKFNADGSLDIVIQREAPADTSNWLPAPEGRFTLMLRLYNPRPEVLDGRWVPPTVTRK